MKIRFISDPITTVGSFSRGKIIGLSDGHSEAFLKHLVECGAAEWIEAPAKVMEDKLDPELKAELKKKEDSPLRVPDRVSKKEISKKRTSIQKS